MASDGRQAAGPKKRKPSSSAALFSRTAPGGEHLAVPSPEPPRQPCLRELRRHRRRMLRRMECPRCRTGSHHFHHDTTLGIGHNLMPLVLHHDTRLPALPTAGDVIENISETRRKASGKKLSITKAALALRRSYKSMT